MTTAAQPPAGVTVRVPGKINLELVVGPRRDDGYHELATVYHAVSIHDHVTVIRTDEWSVRTTGDLAARVPDDESNLALRAAHALAQQHAVEEPVGITIDKQIPVAGGMAGGSADAAAALVACDALWGLGLPREDLAAVASTLGSDVPFLLQGGTAVGSGRGERLAPVLSRGELHWVLWASHDSGLSTAAVYAEADRLRGEAPVSEPEPSDQLLVALRTMDTAAVGACLRNDLQEAALSLAPELADVIEAGRELGVEGAVVSGSGPTVAFLVTSSAAALDLSVGLAARGPEGDIRRAVGPVMGAQVVGPPVPSGPTLHTG